MQLHAGIRWPVNFETNASTPVLVLHRISAEAEMHDQQITYLSSNQRQTHTVRFLCCFAVTIASNIEACAYLSSAIFCRHCRDVRSGVCHGSTILSANFLMKLNHAHKSWSTLSIVWLLLNELTLVAHFTCPWKVTMFHNRVSLTFDFDTSCIHSFISLLPCQNAFAVTYD